MSAVSVRIGTLCATLLAKVARHTAFTQHLQSLPLTRCQIELLYEWAIPITYTGIEVLNTTLKFKPIVAIAYMTVLIVQADAETGDLKHPDWHPDGRKLIAEGSCFGSTDLFLIDLDDGTVRLLWDGGHTEGYPRWFHDGSRVVFHQIDDDRQARLFVASVTENGDIQKAQRLTNGPFDIEPAPSPVGQTIAFSRAGKNGLDIGLVDVATRKVIRSWKTAAAENFPSWFPDGSSIVFHARNNDGTQIYKRDLKTDELSQLTNDNGPNLVANISADGYALAYSSERDNDREIYVRDLRTGTDTRLTDRPGRDGYPKVSPNGKRIAYHSVDDGGTAVVRVMDNSGEALSEYDCSLLPH